MASFDAELIMIINIFGNSVSRKEAAEHPSQQIKFDGRTKGIFLLQVVFCVQFEFLFEENSCVVK